MLPHRWISVPLSRLIVSSVLGIVAVIGSPRPADAWFGWLDKFSGPGGYGGLLFDVRAFCFGEDSPVASLQGKLASARSQSKIMIDVLNTVRLASSDSASVEFRRLFGGFDSAASAFIAELRNVNADFPVIDPAEIASVDAELALMRAVLAGENGSFAALRLPQLISAVQDLDSSLKALGDKEHRAYAALTATGIFLTFCDTSKRTRWAFDVDASVWRTFKGSSDFASGQHVWFAMVAPAVTRHLRSDPSSDFIDAGIGVGAYRFMSRGFEDRGGLLLNPRLEFHGPTAWNSRTGWRRHFAALTLRTGFLILPSEIGAGELGVGSKRVRNWELVKNIAIFFHLPSLRD